MGTSRLERYEPPRALDLKLCRAPRHVHSRCVAFRDDAVTLLDAKYAYMYAKCAQAALSIWKEYPKKKWQKRDESDADISGLTNSPSPTSQFCGHRTHAFVKQATLVFLPSAPVYCVIHVMHGMLLGVEMSQATNG
jgi:hypothetical protein